ncbi:cytochrome P450 [Cubamyces lactineus]|nr:cytochrome P450 [Cubamyces lactineus]
MLSLPGATLPGRTLYNLLMHPPLREARRSASGLLNFFCEAIPHRTMMDDQYRGFDIPAGSMLIPNIWAMSRDTRYYPNPEQFSPERYLSTEVNDQEGVLLPSSFVFGFGRRVCPGQAFAQASIWLAVANIIALFDISKATDRDGNVITPPAEFISGFTSQPAPFVCRIWPRSVKVVDVINQLDA